MAGNEEKLQESVRVKDVHEQKRYLNYRATKQRKVEGWLCGDMVPMLLIVETKISWVMGVTY